MNPPPKRAQPGFGISHDGAARFPDIDGRAKPQASAIIACTNATRSATVAFGRMTIS